MFLCVSVVDEAFPQVDPNRQQHIEYDPIEVSCEGLEGLTGWRVMRKVKEKDALPCSPDWSKSTGPCKITNAFQTSDSGEYWCEMGEKRSNAVNSTVTSMQTVKLSTRKHYTHIWLLKHSLITKTWKICNSVSASFHLAFSKVWGRWTLIHQNNTVCSSLNPVLFLPLKKSHVKVSYSYWKKSIFNIFFI